MVSLICSTYLTPCITNINGAAALSSKSFVSLMAMLAPQVAASVITSMLLEKFLTGWFIISTMAYTSRKPLVAAGQQSRNGELFQ